MRRFIVCLLYHCYCHDKIKASVYSYNFRRVNLYNFSPAVSYVFVFFSVLGMAAGAGIILLGIFFPQIMNLLKKSPIAKITAIIIALILSAFVVFASVFTVKMASAASRDDIPNDAVLIVLGCQIKNSKPGKMLAQRLDAAYDYLAAHPNAVCILSGGQGADEARPEAQAMREYLSHKGIEESRLYTENFSENTKENIENSEKIIRENSLSQNIAVVTHSFHQYRASEYAKEYGLCAYALNCPADPGVLPTYWLRELAAILKMKIKLAG